MSTYNSLFQSIATTKSVTVFAAAGDNGSSDGISGTNVDFPGSSPYVVSCGGTRLTETNPTTIAAEVVWNDNSTSSASGGGISAVFAKPSYQSAVTFPLNNMRGVPDVTGNGDPDTGYNIYVQGQSIIVGGTSAVAPLWSALFARINQSIGHAAGFIQPTLYGHTAAFRDITQGNNGAYSAGVGWDACSGNGSPNGQSILALFAGSTGTTGPAPVAAFSGSPVSGNKPLTVNFTDASTNSPTSWSWNFGDGNTSTSQSPSHVYSTSGTFSVSLTATNSHGSNALTKNSYISVFTPPAPVAAFSGTPTSGSHPLTVTFTDSSSNTPTSWAWNFGDGGTSTTKNPVHIYQSAGTYTVRLTATNGSGSNTATKTNYITVTSGGPVASFTGTPLSGRTPLTVRFTDTSSGSPTSWTWDFGDNTTSTTRNPTHTYTRRGLYTVRLTIRNSVGTNVLTKTNYVNSS
jgi:PKD repeat protein